MANWTEICARIERTKKPDRALDLYICQACNYRPDGAVTPELTKRLDAIVALVEHMAPGMDWDVGRHTIDTPHYQGVTYPLEGGFTDIEGGALMANHNASSALALCLAFARTVELAQQQYIGRTPSQPLRVVK